MPSTSEGSGNNGNNNRVEDVSEVKKKKFGDPYEFDPKFNGPVSNRSCTDIICLILFLAAIFAALIIALFAWSKSNPLLLIHPTDSQGHVCGHGQFASKPYLYFFDLMKCAENAMSLPFQGCPTTQVCVERCPNVTWSWLSLSAMEQVRGVDASARSNQLLCVHYVNFSGDAVSNSWLRLQTSELVRSGLCAPYLLRSQPVLNRCVPEFLVKAVNDLANATSLADANGNTITTTELLSSKSALDTLFKMQSWVETCLADLSLCWRHIVVFVAITVVVSFLWIVLLRFFVGPIIWFNLILFTLLWLFGTAFCFWRYNEITHRFDAAATEIDKLTSVFHLQTNFTSGMVIPGETKFSIPGESADLWIGVGFVCLAILLITLLALCFLGSKIKLAIKLYEEASTALSYMPSVMLWPILPFILQMAALAIAAGTAVCLATLGKPIFANNPNAGLINIPDDWANCDYSNFLTKVSTNSAQTQQQLVSDSFARNQALSVREVVNTTLSEVCRFVKYTGTSMTIVFQLWNGFMFFWSYNFVSGFGMVVLAGSFASYYFSFRKPQDLPAIPLIGAFWRAFRYHIGSIAFGSLLIAIMQIIRIILEYIMYKLKEQKNYVAAYLAKCVQCCFICVEKLVRFVARKAYIAMAIRGSNFCVSGLQAFQLVMRNAVRAVVLSGISRLIIVISKLIVTGGMIVLAYFYFHGEIPTAIPRLMDTWPRLQYFYVPIIIVGIASFTISSVCFHVYEVGVETLFLCCLEDLERNDGSEARPYFMSKRLASILR